MKPTGGFSHIGVSTHDMEMTRTFYESVLGFPRVVDEMTHVSQGGRLRQVYFDVGGGQYIVFMEPKRVPGISDDYDTGINGALGVPAGMYHFALRAETLEELEVRRASLVAHEVDVSEIIDLGTARSIFFADPNNIQVEICCHTRPFDASDLERVTDATVALPD